MVPRILPQRPQDLNAKLKIYQRYESSILANLKISN